jgi:heme/copper-type cytochrome/quinol oxidase subunit 2
MPEAWMWTVFKLISVLAGVVAVLLVVGVTVFAVRQFRHATRDREK